jgi:hypothetical protein
VTKTISILLVAASVVTGQAHPSKVRLADGWSNVDQLDVPYSLVYHDRHLRVYDCRKAVSRPVPKNHGGTHRHTPIWSADGSLLFDVESQVISIDAATAEVRELTGWRLSRGRWIDWWRKGHPERHPSFSTPRFVHDAASNELIFMACNLDDKTYDHGFDLLALNLDTLATRNLLPNNLEEIQGTVWAISSDRRTIYGMRNGAVVAMSSSGSILCQFEPKPGVGVRDLILSNDDRFLVVEYFLADPVRRHSSAAVLDARTLSKIRDIDSGQSFRFSPDGSELAYLDGFGKLVVASTDDWVQQTLVEIEPLPDTPDWSQLRYYAPPAWSADGRMLACGMSRYLNKPHQYDHYVILLDMERQETLFIPDFWRYLSWSPVYRPFEKGN